MLFVQAVHPTNLKIENPALLTHYAQAYIRKKTTEGTMKPPFICEVVVVLGGNIVKSGDRYITTPYQQGTKKSFGAQGRVITSAFLYHLGVSDCLILSTGKTDPEDEGRSVRSGPLLDQVKYAQTQVFIHDCDAVFACDGLRKRVQEK